MREGRAGNIRAALDDRSTVARPGPERPVSEANKSGKSVEMSRTDLALTVTFS